MQYIVQKAFSFAGDSYFAGDVFDPMKYPFLCTTKKLEALIDSRRIKEDFKMSGAEKGKMDHPSEDAKIGADNEDVAQEMGDSDEEDRPAKPRRNK